uniref:Uncharacterized protein n=1 Tax=Eutreptiella gymnastica TaxID=73025 RepID=A0A7S1NMB0_9EUGL|mmetsp:Transcript_57700/g.103104  ORF Transcript_57700/g.103104 Transcript_57700/m.103104 type:complete len:545 (+) Transcript_57700:29-1663(+)
MVKYGGLGCGIDALYVPLREARAEAVNVIPLHNSTPHDIHFQISVTHPHDFSVEPPLGLVRSGNFAYVVVKYIGGFGGFGKAGDNDYSHLFPPKQPKLKVRQSCFEEDQLPPIKLHVYFRGPEVGDMYWYTVDGDVQKSPKSGFEHADMCLPLALPASLAKLSPDSYQAGSGGLEWDDDLDTATNASSNIYHRPRGRSPGPEGIWYPGPTSTRSSSGGSRISFGSTGSRVSFGDMPERGQGVVVGTPMQGYVLLHYAKLIGCGVGSTDKYAIQCDIQDKTQASRFEIVDEDGEVHWGASITQYSHPPKCLTSLTVLKKTLQKEVLVLASWPKLPLPSHSRTPRKATVPVNEHLTLVLCLQLTHKLPSKLPPGLSHPHHSRDVSPASSHRSTVVSARTSPRSVSPGGRPRGLVNIQIRIQALTGMPHLVPNEQYAVRCATAGPSSCTAYQEPCGDGSVNWDQDLIIAAVPVTSVQFVVLKSEGQVDCTIMDLPEPLEGPRRREVRLPMGGRLSLTLVTHPVHDLDWADRPQLPTPPLELEGQPGW